MMPLWQALGLALFAGVVIGGITYAVLKIAFRGPMYSQVDKKTRDTERYLEKAKQGMK